jgi:LmbE family N-acetylglucosaminyl deacetylase
VEEVLAPLVPGEALSGSAVLVAAHPDDEMLGASWLLSRLPGCHIVHVTDGAPRDPVQRPSQDPGSREAYARLREKESFAALAWAGITPQQLVSLGAVEQESVLELVTLTHSLVALLKALRPTLLIVHPYEGGHPDHDSAAFIAHAATALLRRTGRSVPALVEMATYHRQGDRLVTSDFLPVVDAGPVSTVYLSEKDKTAKRGMLASHATQAPLLSAWPLVQERYRAAPGYDFTQAPHPGLLHYEWLGGRMTGTFWRERALRALRELRLLDTSWH